MTDTEEIIWQAREKGASDVHMAAGSPPVMRVGGCLQVMAGTRLTPADTLEILLSLMGEAQREQYEECGECEFSSTLHRAGRCRINAYKQQGGTALSFRLVPNNIPSIEELGMPEEVVRLCDKEEGLILLAGPKGSGRTSALAAMVQEINAHRAVHILTLEKTLEYRYTCGAALVSQREWRRDFVDMGQALRQAARLDADVLAVDQIEDAGALEAAVSAAQAGHLVLAVVCGKDVKELLPLLTASCSERQEHIRQSIGKVLQAVVLLSEKSGREDFGQKIRYRIMREENSPLQKD